MTAPSIATDLRAFNLNIEMPSLAPDRPPPFQHVGQSFMHELARAGDILSAEVMIEAGGKIDLPDDEGRRPLHEAAFFGREEMVKFLVAEGAVLDAPIHPFGYTALHFAVQQGHHGVASWLIGKGAHLGVADRLNGQGLLHVAAQRGDMKMAGLLIAAGIDTLSEDKKGMTARDHAARGNHKCLEGVLLKVMTHHACYGC